VSILDQGPFQSTRSNHGVDLSRKMWAMGAKWKSRSNTGPVPVFAHYPPKRCSCRRTEYRCRGFKIL